MVHFYCEFYYVKFDVFTRDSNKFPTVGFEKFSLCDKEYGLKG